MSKNKIGRNDPCPCGSGKKYKQCCLGKESNTQNSPLDSAMPGFREVLEGQDFNDLEEAEQFANAYMQSRNSRPLEEFHDISPEQMMRLLHFPFESPEVIKFSESKSDVRSVPVIKLILLLLNGIGEKGAKATAKGNLPRNLCREIAVNYYSHEEYQKRTKYSNINTEMDFFDLHVVRIIAKLAGLIKKYKGKYLLTKKGTTFLSEDRQQELYLLLLQVYTSKFNWAYRDGYPELSIIQMSFAFTLYLLSRYGGQWQAHSTFCEYSLNAFPMALNEIEDTAWSTPEKDYQRCYAYRALVNFAIFFDLAEIDADSKKQSLKEDYQIRKLPLLDEIVSFNIRTVH